MRCVSALDSGGCLGMLSSHAPYPPSSPCNHFLIAGDRTQIRHMQQQVMCVSVYTYKIRDELLELGAPCVYALVVYRCMLSIGEIKA